MSESAMKNRDGRGPRLRDRSRITRDPIHRFTTVIRHTAFILVGSAITLFSARAGTPNLVSVERQEAFDGDPDWEGLFNRSTDPGCREVTQDFGYSPSTSNAGGSPGEMGGLLEAAGDPAYYAKPIGPFTFDDPLSASGKLIIPDVNSRMNHFLVGFFNADTIDEWRTPNTVAMRILTRGENAFFAFPEYATQLWRAGSIGETVFTIGPMVHDWSLTYDPGGNGGAGAVTLVIGTETMVTNLESGHKADGATFNRFGLLPVVKSVDSGAESEVWLDDMVIQGVTEDFTSDPGWDAFGNRATFTSCIVRPRFNFGFSPTNAAGGASSGEMGGLIWRGDFRSEEHMAHYADPIGVVSMDGPLKASGRVSLDQGISDSSTLIGWFHSALSRQNGNSNDAIPRNFIGIAVEGPSSEGFFFQPVYRMNGRGDFVQQAGPRILPDAAPRDWTFEYDPEVPPGGSITVTLDDQSITIGLPAAEREAGAEFDRFGIITTQIDGNQQTIYYDDLLYTESQIPMSFNATGDNWTEYEVH